MVIKFRTRVNFKTKIGGWHDRAMVSLKEKVVLEMYFGSRESWNRWQITRTFVSVNWYFLMEPSRRVTQLNWWRHWKCGYTKIETETIYFACLNPNYNLDVRLLCLTSKFSLGTFTSGTFEIWPYQICQSHWGTYIRYIHLSFITYHSSHLWHDSNALKLSVPRQTFRQNVKRQMVHRKWFTRNGSRQLVH